MNTVLRSTCLALALAIATHEKAAGDEPAGFVAPWVVLAKENNEFAFDLYARLRERDGNLFFSPYSISSALAMTYAGARGETAKEMAKTLHFVQQPDRLHPAFAELNARLLPSSSDAKFQLNIANRLWARRGLEVEPEFLQITKQHYGAELETLDFAGATEDARRTINTWTADQTRNKIPELLAPGNLSPDTQLALTNAVYFNAAWKNPFDADNTRPGPFLIAGGKKVETPFMFNRLSTRHFGEDEFDVVALPYDGDQAVMLLLVPRRPDGLATIEKKLTATNLQRWLAAATRCEADVYLPRFRMTDDFELGDTLRAMGMKGAFSGNADFSGIAARGGLSISRVIHKAFVDVNEAGTEAAAATVVLMEKGITGRRVTIRADHPFAFVIQDARTGGILFIGRVAVPGP
jgi:serpin B